MKPHFTNAATQATKVLIKYNVARTPVYPQQIIQASPIATMISFADLAMFADVERSSILKAMHEENELAMSFVYKKSDGSPHYLFAFNRKKPIGEVRFALAVELGHIYLGHTGYRDNETRFAESLCFTHHLIFPRPLIKLLQERGFIFTNRSFARIFGECSDFLDELVTSPSVTISAELNRAVKEQFTPYVDALADAGILSLPMDPSEQILDLSQYMQGYEE